MDKPSTKKKILHTIRQGMIGGGETHVLDLVASLPKDLFYSEVLAFTEGEMVERLAKMGVKCHVIPTTRPFDIKVWGKVKKLVEDRGFDLIHAHGTRACSNSFWAANKLGLPLVYTIHGWSFHQDQNRVVRRLRELSEKFLVRRTSINVSVSQSNNNDGIERLGMPNSRIINYGVNLNRFNANANYKLSRKDFNIPDNKILVGLVVRLTTQKDPLTFLRAAREVVQHSDSIHFVVVGGGELEENCKAFVEENHLQQHVSFVGFRTDVPAVLNLLDIYCLPSLWEGLPIGILEAMAMAKPIVATPVDGSKEVIHHNDTGMLFDEFDYKTMAKHILELALNNKKRETLGKNALLRIHRDFTVERMGREIGELYAELLTEQQPVRHNA